MTAQKLSPICCAVRSASVQSPDFGKKTSLKANRTDRERTNYVEIDRNTSYDDYEQTRRPLIVPPEFPSGKSQIKRIQLRMLEGIASSLLLSGSNQMRAINTLVAVILFSGCGTNEDSETVEQPPVVVTTNEVVTTEAEPNVEQIQMLTAKLNKEWTEDRRNSGDKVAWSSDVIKTDSLVNPVQAKITMTNVKLDRQYPDEPKMYQLTFVYTWKNGKWQPLSLNYGRLEWIYKNVLDLTSEGVMPVEFSHMAKKAAQDAGLL